MAKKKNAPQPPQPWTVLEEKSAQKSIAKAPPQVQEKYAEWVAVVRASGITGLRRIYSYDDKELVGQKNMSEERRLRSSRLSQQWRVYYRADRSIFTVTVIDVNAHNLSSPLRGRKDPMASKSKAAKGLSPLEEMIATSAKNTSTRPYVVRVKRTPGQAVKSMRELQHMSQTELAKASGLDQPTISGIECGRIPLGQTRGVRIARALRVHPAVILFPNG